MGDDQCCGDGDSTQYNPKRDGRRRTNQLWFAEPPSPIPAQIEDSGDLRQFFSNYKDYLIPYAGTDQYTSHALQSFLISLCELSPTKAAVLKSQTSHAFGGKIDIVEKKDPVYELGERREITPSEKQAFYEFAKQIIVSGAGNKRIDFRTLAQYQFHDFKASGDYWFELVRTETIGVRSFRVHTHNPTHCIYIATEAMEQRKAAISPFWTHDYILRYRPRVLPVSTQDKMVWLDEGDGVQRTLVHIKNGNNTWYGRPDDLASMLDQFFEFQNSDYKNKQTASQFIGQAFIEVEDANPEYAIGDPGAEEDGFDTLSQQFEENYTNRGVRPQRVILSTRPYGTKEAFVFQFSPNTNENWFDKTEQIAERNIIKANSWSKHLLDLDTSNGFSTNVYLDVFEIFSATVIEDYEHMISGPINNIILKEAAEWLDREEMMQYSFDYTSPFMRMLQKRNENGNQVDNAR